MPRLPDIALTALAPAIWGCSYLAITLSLPPDHALGIAALRALPAGLLLLLFVRRLPRAGWMLKLVILGALNFTVFWSLLNIAAYRLPGGIAATVGAIQPLFVIALARLALSDRIRSRQVIAGLMGLTGVALLVLTSQARIDAVGVLAGLGGAAAMAAGSVLTRRWQFPVSPLTLTAWQLTAGGVLLVPLALLAEGGLPPINALTLGGLAWLALPGAALTYWVWFRGLALIGPARATLLGFLSPMTAACLGWAVLGQSLSATQIGGMLVVLVSLWLSQTSPPPGTRVSSAETEL
ncbi:EamA family transporter [Maricaulis maris]|uniref:Putative blue pigment (Indigoidine) exporter n=1 Tax=Maricaulis maris TaxID=74318 RepID=A0A495DDW2_9PROT|nr:EamA family transporter [Maricaulis maris]RKR00512.1 putative blue pigment (indigoidine) exporter [Maricaulis maris]